LEESERKTVLKVILRFFEPRSNFLKKKDLKLHLTVEVEVLSFGNMDVSVFCERFWERPFWMRKLYVCEKDEPAASAAYARFIHGFCAPLRALSR